MGATLNEHGVETCHTPRASRRRRNMLWVCPVCGQPWVLQHRAAVEAAGPDEYRMATTLALWSWFRFALGGA